MEEAAIACEALWKIFGRRADEAMEAVRSEGISKEEVRARFDCVVGVRDASFTVRTGEIFCIMGLSGSGKSTLIRHVNRLIEPTSGRVVIEGRDVGALGAKELRQLRAEKIGMVFQNMALMPHRTVRDNVSYGLEVRGVGRAERVATAEKALETVELAGWGKSYPDELSGGMQQRVGLARALAADPRILLMDEPFSALDPLIRRQLQDQFMVLASSMRKTTLFITHDLDEAIRIGDRIAVMKDGVLVQIGTPEDIVMRPADAYVADFVAGISKLHLITARRIMEPWAEYEARFAGEAEGWPVAAVDDKLEALVGLAAESDHPILVVGPDGAREGGGDQAPLVARRAGGLRPGRSGRAGGGRGARRSGRGGAKRGRRGAFLRWCRASLLGPAYAAAALAAFFFARQEGGFALHAPAIAGEAPVGGDDAVAGDEACDAVLSAGARDGPRRPRPADIPCERAVACRFARRDGSERLPDAALEGGALDVQRQGGGKCRVLPAS